MKRSYLKIIVIIILLLIIAYAIYNAYENFESDNKYVCFYAYYEKNDLYKENLVYFLENAILDNVDYYIIINGESTVPEITEKTNIKVLKRENNGYDFGAYGHAIKQLTKSYDYYIFLNATVRGPYLNNEKDWLEAFLPLFNDNVKLVGASVSYTNSHLIKEITDKDTTYYVQTPFFIIKNDFFDYLVKQEDFFNEYDLNDTTDVQHVVIHKEIKLSILCFKFGGNINCYLEKYRNHDYTKMVDDINPSSYYGDGYFVNRYFNTTIQPNDVVFYKNKRFLQDHQE
jgi:lipopolysaccharide biosynthesis protein